MKELNKLQIIEGIRMTDRDGIIMMNLEDVSRKLGLVRNRKDKIEVRWSRVEGYLNDYGVCPQVGADTMIEESVVYLLAMKASNKLAKEFQIKVATEIIPNYRKRVQGKNILPQSFAEALQLAANQAKQIEIQSKQLEIKDKEIEVEKDKRVVQQMLSEALYEREDRLDLIPKWGSR